MCGEISVGISVGAWCPDRRPNANDLMVGYCVTLTNVRTTQVSDKVPCSKCGVSILLSTAQKTNGLCMPCKGGYRESIEARKREIQEERERERTDPYRHLWLSLINQVYHSPAGFDGLSHPRKIYFAIGCLGGDVYNGGFHQYFFNDSGSYYAYAEEGLIAIGALRTCELLNEAKQVLFGSDAVPVNISERRKALQDLLKNESETAKSNEKLADVDGRYYLDTEGIEARMKAFAGDRKLLDWGVQPIIPE